MSKPNTSIKPKQTIDQAIQSMANLQARTFDSNLKRIESMRAMLGGLENETSQNIRYRLEEMAIVLGDAKAACDEVGLLTRLMTSVNGNDKSEALHAVVAAARRLGLKPVKI